MLHTATRLTLVFLLALCPFLVAQDATDATDAPKAPAKLKALILDGANNHDWASMTPVMQATLEACGRFEVEVSSLPKNDASPEAWAAWNPEFKNYDVVISNYNDGGRCLWPAERRQQFQSFVFDGGGFVSVHAADNSSADWPAYNEMIAVGGWGGRSAKKSGSLLRKTDGTWGPDPAPKAASGGHGAQWAFPVRNEAPEHPIMRGIPAIWKHAKDELYNTLRGPCKRVTVLASAPARATGVDEPMAMLIEYGKGRVFHLPMGHVGSTDTLRCVGFQTLLARGSEFVASGKVTLPVPPGFPKADTISLLDPAQVNWR
jgi:type 1 glutamine amidotransferase